MKHSRLLISGGGSLLQDATSTKSFFYYSYIMRLARRSGAKLMVYANGLGPLSGKRNIDIARRVLAQANVVTLRDRESLEFFSSLETGSVARLTGDPALCYKPCDSHTARLILHKMGINDKKYFIVALRRGKNSVLVHNVADYCNLMVREKGIYPLFVCMQKRVDHSVVEELKRSCPEGFVLPENISISEMLGVYAASEFVLGMRLHSLIYAAAVRRPMLGIRYDPKVSSFLSCVGYGDFVVGERVTTGELFNKSSVILLDRERRDMLAKTVGELCTLAHADADTAVKLIESK